jgi:hypothetical protein
MSEIKQLGEISNGLIVGQLSLTQTEEVYGYCSLYWNEDGYVMLFDRSTDVEAAIKSLIPFWDTEDNIFNSIAD